MSFNDSGEMKHVKARLPIKVEIKDREAKHKLVTIVDREGLFKSIVQSIEGTNPFGDGQVDQVTVEFTLPDDFNDDDMWVVDRIFESRSYVQREGDGKFKSSHDGTDFFWTVIKADGGEVTFEATKR